MFQPFQENGCFCSTFQPYSSCVKAGPGWISPQFQPCSSLLAGLEMDLPIFQPHFSPCNFHLIYIFCSMSAHFRLETSLEIQPQTSLIFLQGELTRYQELQPPNNWLSYLQKLGAEPVWLASCKTTTNKQNEMTDWISDCNTHENPCMPEKQTRTLTLDRPGAPHGFILLI